MGLDVRKAIKDHSLPKGKKPLSPKGFAITLFLLLGTPHKGSSCPEMLWTCVQSDLDLRKVCYFPF